MQITHYQLYILILCTLLAVSPLPAATAFNLTHIEHPREIVSTRSSLERRMIDATRTYIQAEMVAKNVPGLSIALAVDGHVTWQAAFGYSDLAKAQPMRLETLYRSGSIAKLYTATAVMQLVETGALSLDDPINRCLPFAVENPLGARAITIRDLLTHRSGLAIDNGASAWTAPGSWPDLLAHEYKRPHSGLFGGTVPRWQAKVGEQWNYSNLGVATLGLIVERCNPEHLAFADYIERHIFSVLHMRDSQFARSSRPGELRTGTAGHLSTGYTRMGAALIPSLPLFFSDVPAAGLITRPLENLHLLMAMLNGGTLNGIHLLNRATVREMLTPLGQTEEAGVEQGLIWQMSHQGERSAAFFHDGGHAFGWRMISKAWPAFRAAVVIATNQWNLPIDANDSALVEDYIERWLQLTGLNTQGVRGLDQPAWQVSYVRGALLAAIYGTSIGVSGTFPTEDLRWSAANTRLAASSESDWDAAAFKQGVHDMRATGFAIDRVRAFWRSAECKVSERTARLIYAQLGGRFESGGIDDLFLPPPRDLTAHDPE